MFLILLGLTLSSAQPADLNTYCNALVAACPDVHGFGASDAGNCQNAFQNFTLGTINDTDVNTIGCRFNFLNNPALNTSTRCQYAGPTGGGKCGSALDGTCRIVQAACGGTPYVDATDCNNGLASISAQFGWKQGAAALGEDTLECRSYAAVNALINGGSCTNVNLTGSACSGAPVPNAMHYCEIVTYACTGANSQYRVVNDCWNSTGAFAPTPADSRISNTKNSLGCREYHAQAAISAPAIHCQHAGPSGGKFCGTFTQAWASLSQNNCGDGEVAAAVLAMGEPTMALAIPVGDGSAYTSGTPATVDTQACRIYHLTVAASLPAVHCIHGTINGGSFCGQDPTTNLCTYIGGICGFANDATHFADANTCYQALNGTAIGSLTGAASDATLNTLGCRFYHARVAASYLPNGTLGTGANAATLYAQHCSHVLKTTPAGGCNYVPPPTQSSASTTHFLASLVIVVASVFAL